MGLAIHHLAMRSRDVGRLERFYVEILELPVVRRDSEKESVWLRAGSALIMLECAGVNEPPIPLGSAELVAFDVDDKERWRSRLLRAAVTIEDETAYTLYFRDPDGRRIAVSTFKMRPELEPAPAAHS